MREITVGTRELKNRLSNYLRLVKAVRSGWVDEADLPIAWQGFLSHWPAYTRQTLSAETLESATSLAWQNGLRAYEAVHLSERWFGRT